MKEYDFLVFGSVTSDIFLSSQQFRLLSGQSLGAKTAICTLYGEKVEIRQRLISSGGGGSNVAVGLGRLGLKTALVARLGNDCFGQQVVRELKKEKNLDCRYLVIKPEETDQSVILVGPTGERTILVFRGQTRLEKKHLPRARAKNYYLASLEGNLDLAAAIIQRAKKEGRPVFWNPGQRELAQRQEVRQLAQNTVLFLNQTEAEELFTAQGAQLERRLHRAQIPILVITQGAGGATVFWQKKRYYQPAVMVPVRDTTGAGDAFASAFAAALSLGHPPPEALVWGLVNSAQVVSYWGAKTGLLSRRQLLALARRYGRL